MDRFHLTSKQLQSEEYFDLRTMGTVVSLYKTLILCASSMRDISDIHEKRKASNQ